MKNSLLIRALVVASLALLVAGAVSPLLTTERFYFFSNTFSLISGLRELLENDQLLIATLIALFSLCVPVAKASVIWVAASGQAHSRPLLAVADRLGKWSMLEVFIAALLIMALKLGPIVDATLHYGVWLLAGSVLLSGLASQLLDHEPHTKSLFSSPQTLTIGAVGGALAAISLVAVINIDMLRFDALVGTPESRCVQRVLRLDRLYATSSSTEAEYVTGLRLIDEAACPEAFRDAFAGYADAFARLAALPTDDAAAEPGLLDRAFALVGLGGSREDALEDVEAAWDQVVEVALEYGVDAPAK
jgi:paraquat-inducible protein A